MKIVRRKFGLFGLERFYEERFYRHNIVDVLNNSLDQKIAGMDNSGLESLEMIWHHYCI